MDFNILQVHSTPHHYNVTEYLPSYSTHQSDAKDAYLHGNGTQISSSIAATAMFRSSRPMRIRCYGPKCGEVLLAIAVPHVRATDTMSLWRTLTATTSPVRTCWPYLTFAYVPCTMRES